MQLPRAGSLDLLTANAPVTGVGYGAYAVPNGPGGHRYLYNDVRMAANGTLNSETKSWLRISENPCAGNGGGCFGDTGGPNFLAGTNIEAASTITGDAICRSTNTAYRLDTPSARDFLRTYVTLPDPGTGGVFRRARPPRVGRAPRCPGTSVHPSVQRYCSRR